MSICQLGVVPASDCSYAKCESDLLTINSSAAAHVLGYITPFFKSKREAFFSPSTAVVSGMPLIRS
jgi:hypothetical protein